MFSRKAIEILRSVKEAIREPYAWPGGYPKYIVTNDGEALSVAAAKAEFKQVAWSTLHRSCEGWQAYAVNINWEDPDLYCAHTNERIESAYAED